AGVNEVRVSGRVESEGEWAVARVEVAGCAGLACVRVVAGSRGLRAGVLRIDNEACGSEGEGRGGINGINGWGVRVGGACRIVRRLVGGGGVGEGGEGGGGFASAVRRRAGGAEAGGGGGGDIRGGEGESSEEAWGGGEVAMPNLAAGEEVAVWLTLRASPASSATSLGAGGGCSASPASSAAGGGGRGGAGGGAGGERGGGAGCTVHVHAPLDQRVEAGNAGVAHVRVSIEGEGTRGEVLRARCVTVCPKP
ncbi:hypothetical protein T484DRAFT_1825140, partial [Baffinella frigidus]